MATRRETIKNLVGGAAAVGLGLAAGEKSMEQENTVLKGNIHHSICRWTLNQLSLEEMCLACKQMGVGAIDLVGPTNWHILKQHGIFSSMCNGAEINLVDGWIDPKFHPRLIESYLKHIDLVADAGYTNLILFTGNKRGMDPETGMRNMLDGLKKVIGKAEQRGVVLQLEVFNSKVDHPDYMADNTPWSVELVKQLGSPNFKILYDIYHMQIMEGDVIRTIQQNHQYFGHYHTAGVPGRHEIDDSQELFYPAIMRAIVATGYKGYVAQEFLATASDKVESMRKAVMLCDV